MLRIILYVLAVFCIKIETTIKYHIYPVQNIAHCGSRSVTPAIVGTVSSSQNIASQHKPEDGAAKMFMLSRMEI